MDSPSPTVEHIAECFIKPKHVTEDSKQPYYLSQWDLVMLSVHYIQKGLLFPKPQDFVIKPYLENLKNSLSLTLVHFYPLAGRLKTSKSDQNPDSCFVLVDCSDSPGARFIHAAVNMEISDILSPTYVPLVVQSLFDHDRAVNHDGHTVCLLSVQVTELVDGIFIGCSINHCVADGTSFWNFFTAWSQIFQSQENYKINYPIHERWFPENHGPILKLPFNHPDQFICRIEAPLLTERIFHFSAESIAKLKAKANFESNTNKISSFQSLSALVWRCVTRVRRLPYDQETGCRLAINNRSRLEPPLPNDFFGNCIQTVRGVSSAGNLLEQSFGWAAWQVHQAVVNHSNKMVREWVEEWIKSPYVYQFKKLFDPYSVMMGSSPRFNKYGCEFGLGKAVAIRSGYANKFDGKVSSYPGSDGGGSVDLEVCLPPESMSALEADEEFMEAASLSILSAPLV